MTTEGGVWEKPLESDKTYLIRRNSAPDPYFPRNRSTMAKNVPTGSLSSRAQRVRVPGSNPSSFGSRQKDHLFRNSSGANSASDQRQTGQTCPPSRVT